jgi:N-acetylmuramoyl-L-alanine amidase
MNGTHRESKLVALDDGHGLETAGKKTPEFPDGSFMRENEFNNAVVKLVAMDLRRHNVEVVFTALTDEDVPLAVRTEMANNSGADIFVSVHANAYGNGEWNDIGGIETYHYPSSVNGKMLAEKIHKYLIRGTPLADRGIKTATWYVLKYTHMPAVLVECGFMTNKEEARLLLSDAYRAECAGEITQGILDYFDMEYVQQDGQESEQPNGQPDYKQKYEDLRTAIREALEEY